MNDSQAEGEAHLPGSIQARLADLAVEKMYSSEKTKAESKYQKQVRMVFLDRAYCQKDSKVEVVVLWPKCS